MKTKEPKLHIVCPECGNKNLKLVLHIPMENGQVSFSKWEPHEAIQSVACDCGNNPPIDVLPRHAVWHFMDLVEKTFS